MLLWKQVKKKNKEQEVFFLAVKKSQSSHQKALWVMLCYIKCNKMFLTKNEIFLLRF